MLVAGELTQNCIADMRELYGLPAKDCDSAELLLDLYEEVLLHVAVVNPDIVTMQSFAVVTGRCNTCSCFTQIDPAISCLSVGRCKQ